MTFNRGMNTTQMNYIEQKKNYAAPLLKDNQRRARNYCRRTGQLKAPAQSKKRPHTYPIPHL